jgi:mRNA degradation ribonuclease J1/J2
MQADQLYEMIRLAHGSQRRVVVVGRSAKVGTRVST